MRKPIIISNFTKGVVHKTEYVGGPSIIRLLGWRMGRKAGTLESFGGFDDWDTSINFQEMNGIFRWYDSDGGATLYVFGNDGSNYGLWEYGIAGKTLSFIQADTNFDRNAPVQFVNCGSQVIYIPQGKTDTPYAAKLRNSSIRIATDKLGLRRPTDKFTVTATVDANNPNMIAGNKTYKWYLSYSYGTKSEPEKYGESDLSDPVTLVLPTTAGSWSATIANFSGISVLIQRINIYRTLGDGITPYRIGYIDTVGTVIFYDTYKDSSINLSRTRPIYFGLPSTILCGLWHNSRFYFFGPRGKFGWSAAGYPDIHPATFYTYIGQTGYEGTWIGVIRDNIFVGKEDGIFVIQGQSPNYVWRKICDVQCFSRDSLVAIDDALYFLGKEGQDTKVYKFNGYAATPISETITGIFRDSSLTMHHKAFGVKVGKEYWLSIMTSDSRYAKSYVPFNNLILVYDTDTGGWFPNLGDAAALTVCDGHMDNNEVYIVESDPFNSSVKGTVLRYNRFQSRVNCSFMNAGVRLYSKILAVDRSIAILFPGVNAGSLEKNISHALKVRVRGLLGGVGATPRLVTYDDSETLQRAITNGTGPEPTQEYADISQSGDSASIYDTGKYGSCIYEDRLVEEYNFGWNDNVQKNGMVVDFRTPFTVNRRVEVEAFEYLYELTERER